MQNNANTMIKKLNFGCGNELKEGYDNADIQEGAELCFDFDKFPYPIEDDTYDYVYSSMVIEHLKYPERVIDELVRITKPNGVIEIGTAHYTNNGAYTDLTHRVWLNERAFENYANREKKINKNSKVKIISIKVTPTKIGKLIPTKLRRKLALVVNGLLSQIWVRFKVIK